MADDDAPTRRLLHGTPDEAVDGVSNLAASLGHVKLVDRVIQSVDQPQAAFL